MGFSFFLTSLFSNLREHRGVYINMVQCKIMSEGWEGFLNCKNSLSTGLPLSKQQQSIPEARENTKLNINMTVTVSHGFGNQVRSVTETECSTS